MHCEICGHHHLRRLPTSAEKWVCSWCYAVTEVGEELPTYVPVTQRWERAEMPDWEAQPRHAYGYLGTTLCGVSGEGVSTSPYPWVPEWDSTCQACRDAADVIDQRWPLDKRLPRPNRAKFDPLDEESPPF